MKKLIFHLWLFIKLQIQFICDFIFLILLLIDINISNLKRDKIDMIRVLIEFLGRTDLYYCYTSFSRYKSENKDKLFTFYYSLKNKNSLIFQWFSFFYSFLIEYYLQYSIYILIPYELNSNLGEIIEDMFFKLRKKMQYYTENNFIYQYLLEFQDYKNKYSKLDYCKYSVIIFFLETYLNISYYFNGQIYNFKFLRKIEDRIELKIESYF